MRALINQITALDAGPLLGWAAIATVAFVALWGIARLISMSLEACYNWEDDSDE